MKALVLALFIPLCGCGTIQGKFENRLTCTIDGSRSYFISLYGPLGISAEVQADDARAICGRPK